MLRKDSLLIVLIMILGSCTTVNKSSGSRQDQTTNADSSSLRKQHTKETTTTQVADTTVQTRADSLSLEEFFSLWDMSERRWTMQAGALQLDIIATSRSDSATGKPTGLDIKAKVKKAPEKVHVPVKNTTTTKETGSEEQKAVTVQTHTETETWWTKQTKRLPAWWPIAVIVAVLGLILIIALKYLKRWM